MKEFCLLILLIISTTNALSQDTVRVQQRALDSLHLRIKNHPKADTVRVHYLIDYAQLCFYDLDFLKGLKAANEARSISKKINFIKGEGLYLKSMAIFNQRIHLGNEFIRNLDVYYEVEGNRILQQYTNFDIFGGIIMPYGGRDLEIENIISNLQKALSYFTNQEDFETIANIQNALAIVFNDLDKEKSREYKKLAQNLFHKLGQSYAELTIIINDIKDFWRQGKDEEAKALEIKAINIYTKEVNKNIKALCASMLGKAYAYNNRINLGLEYLFEAEELLKELGDKDLLRTVYLTIATTYEWSILDSEKALEYEQKEINLRKELGYNEGIHFTYLLISQSLLGLNRIQEFPDEYKDYLKIGGAGKMIWFDAEFLWVKARMLQAQGKSEGAQLVFQESMAIFLKN